MRDQFLGYYGPTEEDFKRMWHEGIFVPDANVLLDVYRFSDETVTQLLATFERLGNRLWLPYQAALEYHRNLTSVIAQQQKPYRDTLEQVSQLRGTLSNPIKHPFVDPELLQEIDPALERLEAALKERQTKVAELLSTNPNKEHVGTLFTGKLGPQYDPKTLELIYKEGAERYTQRIPPGYADGKDKPEPDRYGDLVLWKQVIDKAKEAGRPIILITSDIKEDWFLRVAGKTIGPRPELIAEMQLASGVPFHIYTITAFLQYANQYLDARVPEAAIEEVATNERALNDKPSSLDLDRSILRFVAQASIRESLNDPELQILTFARDDKDRFAGLLSDGRKFMVPVANLSQFVLYRNTAEGYVIDAIGPGVEEDIARFVGSGVSPQAQADLEAIPVLRVMPLIRRSEVDPL